jgi:hypothetical protein
VAGLDRNRSAGCIRQPPTRGPWPVTGAASRASALTDPAGMGPTPVHTAAPLPGPGCLPDAAPVRLALPDIDRLPVDFRRFPSCGCGWHAACPRGSRRTQPTRGVER